MNRTVASFLVGFVAAACVTSAVAYRLLARAEKLHSDCPVERATAALKAFASLSDQERESVTTMFSMFANEGAYPILTSHIGCVRTVVALYDGKSDDQRFVELAARILREADPIIQAASTNAEMSGLWPEIEETRRGIDAFLQRHPEVGTEIQKQKNGEPVATDNPVAAR